jgi:DNA-binding GntR family transcriptional regulator
MKNVDHGKTKNAYQFIKSKIIEGELQPLSDISEEALQKEFNISRTPIREAIQQLRKEGFVYIYPRKGTIVSEVTTDLIYEIYELRELNEPYIAKKACKHMSQEFLVNIRESFITPPKDILKEQLRRYYVDLDRKLHNEILEYCENRFLKSIMTNAYDHNQRMRIKVAYYDKDYESTILEHVAIVDALLARDETKVGKAVTEHIYKSRENTRSTFI